VLIIRMPKLFYTASGIITPVGGRPVHRVLSQPVHGTNYTSPYSKCTLQTPQQSRKYDKTIDVKDCFSDDMLLCACAIWPTFFFFHVIPICRFIHKPDMLCIICTDLRHWQLPGETDNNHEKSQISFAMVERAS